MPDPTDVEDQYPDSPDAVWSDLWNPHINSWDPTTDTLRTTEDTDVVGYQEHVDEYTTPPLSESYGVERGVGTAPDPRLNVLTNVRQPGPTPAPPQVIRHEVETYERGSDEVRARTVVITRIDTPVVLLEENPNRKRALIKVITSNAVVMIQPGRVGGSGVQFSAIPSGNSGMWAQATGDPNLEVKSTDQVECYGTGANTAGLLTTPISVTIWEEMYAAVPGTGGIIG